MSRTFAHSPKHVVAVRAGEVKHNHSRSGCTFNPDDPANKSFVAPWKLRKNHWKSCKKVRQYDVSCYHFKAKQKRLDWITGFVKTVIDYGHCNEVHVFSRVTGEKVDNANNFHKFIKCHVDYDESNTAHMYDTLDSGFEEWDSNFVRHTYILTVREEEIPCDCDDAESPINAKLADYPCGKAADYRVTQKFRPHHEQSYWDYFLSPEEKYGTRNSVRMGLHDLAAMFNNGENLHELDTGF